MPPMASDKLPSPEASLAKNYRQLARKYPPDRLAANGLPEEFGQVATENFRSIQEAYEAISKERGIK